MAARETSSELDSFVKAVSYYQSHPDDLSARGVLFSSIDGLLSSDIGDAFNTLSCNFLKSMSDSWGRRISIVPPASLIYFQVVLAWLRRINGLPDISVDKHGVKLLQMLLIQETKFHDHLFRYASFQENMINALVSSKADIARVANDILKALKTYFGHVINTDVAVVGFFHSIFGSSADALKVGMTHFPLDEYGGFWQALNTNDGVRGQYQKLLGNGIDCLKAGMAHFPLVQFSVFWHTYFQAAQYSHLVSACCKREHDLDEEGFSWLCQLVIAISKDPETPQLLKTKIECWLCNTLKACGQAWVSDQAMPFFIQLIGDLFPGFVQEDDSILRGVYAEASLAQVTAFQAAMKTFPDTEDLLSLIDYSALMSITQQLPDDKLKARLVLLFQQGLSQKNKEDLALRHGFLDALSAHALETSKDDSPRLTAYYAALLEGEKKSVEYEAVMKKALALRSALGRSYRLNRLLLSASTSVRGIALSYLSALPGFTAVAVILNSNSILIMLELLMCRKAVMNCGVSLTFSQEWATFEKLVAILKEKLAVLGIKERKNFLSLLEKSLCYFIEHIPAVSCDPLGEEAPFYDPVIPDEYNITLHQTLMQGHLDGWKRVTHKGWPYLLYIKRELGDMALEFLTGYEVPLFDGDAPRMAGGAGGGVAEGWTATATLTGLYLVIEALENILRSKGGAAIRLPDGVKRLVHAIGRLFSLLSSDLVLNDRALLAYGVFQVAKIFLRDVEVDEDYGDTKALFSSFMPGQRERETNQLYKAIKDFDGTEAGLDIMRATLAASTAPEVTAATPVSVDTPDPFALGEIWRVSAEEGAFAGGAGSDEKMPAAFGSTLPGVVASATGAEKGDEEEKSSEEPPKGASAPSAPPEDTKPAVAVAPPALPSAPEHPPKGDVPPALPVSTPAAIPVAPPPLPSATDESASILPVATVVASSVAAMPSDRVFADSFIAAFSDNIRKNVTNEQQLATKDARIAMLERQVAEAAAKERQLQAAVRRTAEEAARERARADALVPVAVPVRTERDSQKDCVRAICASLFAVAKCDAIKGVVAAKERAERRALGRS